MLAPRPKVPATVPTAGGMIGVFTAGLIGVPGSAKLVSKGPRPPSRCGTKSEDAAGSSVDEGAAEVEPSFEVLEPKVAEVDAEALTLATLWVIAAPSNPRRATPPPPPIPFTEEEEALRVELLLIGGPLSDLLSGNPDICGTADNDDAGMTTGEDADDDPIACFFCCARSDDGFCRLLSPAVRCATVR